MIHNAKKTARLLHIARKRAKQLLNPLTKHKISQLRLKQQLCLVLKLKPIFQRDSWYRRQEIKIKLNHFQPEILCKQVPSVKANRNSNSSFRTQLLTKEFLLTVISWMPIDDMKSMLETQSLPESFLFRKIDWSKQMKTRIRSLKTLIWF